MVVAPVAGLVGEKVIAYIDHLGRIEGVITAQIDGGFVMDISASSRKRDMPKLSVAGPTIRSSVTDWMP